MVYAELKVISSKYPCYPVIDVKAGCLQRLWEEDLLPEAGYILEDLIDFESLVYIEERIRDKQGIYRIKIPYYLENEEVIIIKNRIEIEYLGGLP